MTETNNPSGEMERCPHCLTVVHLVVARTREHGPSISYVVCDCERTKRLLE